MGRALTPALKAAARAARAADRAESLAVASEQAALYSDTTVGAGLAAPAPAAPEPAAYRVTRVTSQAVTKARGAKAATTRRIRANALAAARKGL